MEVAFKLAETSRSMTNSNQKVGMGGVGYQATGDVTVNNGMSPTQMGEIMIALSQQLSSFLLQAKATQEARFEEFRDSIIKEFSKPESTANAEAFSDPDFQYVIRDAHETFARNGSRELKSDLVKLISERSKKSTGSRIATILNSCIEMSGKLSNEEYAALSMIFLITGVVVSIPHPSFIYNHYNKLTSPLISSLPQDRSSLSYLSSLGCVTINSVMTRSLESSLTETYKHALSEGFSSDDLSKCLEDTNEISYLKDILYTIDNSNKYYFSCGSDGDFAIRLSQTDLSEKTKQALIQLRQAKSASEAEVMKNFREGVSDFSLIEKFWNSSGATQCDLTLIGKAMAHSTLAGRANLSAPLEIWVK